MTFSKMIKTAFIQVPQTQKQWEEELRLAVIPQNKSHHQLLLLHNHLDALKLEKHGPMLNGC